MTQEKKVYFIGIGGIGVSALARYYLSQGWKVSGSDSTDSQLIQTLQNEGCDVIIGGDVKRLEGIDLVIHTEAIPTNQSELSYALKNNITTLKYNKALGKIINTYKLISISGTHGKSTTTSMISQVLKNSREDFTSVVGTLLKEFDGKNFYTRGNKNYFVIEACEYKEHFLEYNPLVSVITNIEYDHADYFKTPKQYTDTFEKYLKNIIAGGFCILNAEDENCKKLIGQRKDISYILVYKNHFSILAEGEEISGEDIPYPDMELQVPGEHILFDAHLAYIVGHMIGIDDGTIIETLEDYSGVWRRMEIVGETSSGNTLMSDYGHHPTEIKVTLRALKNGYPDKKIFTVFQPHQYSRTLELLDGFQESFSDTDFLVISNIYESRDTEEDKKKINSEKLIELVQHPSSQDGKTLDDTLKIIEKYDKENPNSSIILLLGAGDIDTLRFKIIT